MFKLCWIPDHTNAMIFQFISLVNFSLLQYKSIKKVSQVYFFQSGEFSFSSEFSLFNFVLICNCAWIKWLFVHCTSSVPKTTTTTTTTMYNYNYNNSVRLFDNQGLIFFFSLLKLSLITELKKYLLNIQERSLKIVLRNWSFFSYV